VNIADCHERLLEAALDAHRKDPEFRFAMRMRDQGDSRRMERGYWFTGNDDYLRMGLVKPNDPKNKTRTVGYGVEFDELGAVSSCFLGIVFKGIREDPQKKIYARMLADLGPFKNIRTDTYHLDYLALDPVISFQEFLSKDYPRLRKIIRSENAERDFLISPNEFEDMLGRIKPIRARLKGMISRP
jgi:hypothetical protein